MAQWFANYYEKKTFEENKNVFSILDFVGRISVNCYFIYWIVQH